MAEKIEMKGKEINNILQLKRNFDIKAATEYFQSGKLLKWLNEHFYEDAADEVSQLSEFDENFTQKLGAIFGVEIENVPLNKIINDEETKRLEEIKKYTHNPKALKNFRQIALNQKELEKLAEKYEKIFLCGDCKFVIPLDKKNKTYEGMGENPIVVKIPSDTPINFDSLNIHFENIKFDGDYKNVQNPDYLFNLAEGAAKNEDNETAFKYYKMAAEKNHPKAMCEIGCIYSGFAGEGFEFVEQDIDEALKWLEKAVEKENIDAIYLFGRIYRGDFGNEFGIETDWDEALKYFEMAAEKDDADAMYELYLMYYDDDFKKAIHWLTESANRGKVESLKKLGYIYLDGENGKLKKDINLATECFKKAAEHEDTNSMLQLGDIFEIKNENEQAQKWWHKGLKRYEQSANDGDTFAMRNIAYIYINEEKITKGLKDGVRRDKFSAMNWLNKAVKLDDSDAMMQLGDVYNEMKEYESALEYYKMAADKDNAEAMNMIGIYYDRGNGVEKNKELAFEWYLKAAEAGSSIGMANVGVCYRDAEGVEINSGLADYWLSKSVEKQNLYGMLEYGYFLSNYDDPKAKDLLQEVYHRGFKSEIENLKWMAGKAAYGLSILYKEGKGVKKDQENYLLWKKEAEELGYSENSSSGGCFITTAVLKNFSKSDDCYELTTFRKFRDEFLTKEFDGKFLIEEYYKIAPTIVKNINSRDDADEIYKKIWDKYLKDCLKLIERGEMKKCKNKYVEMVQNLKKSFSNDAAKIYSIKIKDEQ